MVIHPGDEDDRKTQDEREDRWPETLQCEPQLAIAAHPFRGRYLDVDDQERQGNGKDSVTESLEPRVGMCVSHAVSASVYAVYVIVFEHRANHCLKKDTIHRIGPIMCVKTSSPGQSRGMDRFC